MRHILTLSIMAFCFASCKSSTSPENAAPSVPDSSTIEQLFPLAYGDYWSYEIDGYDTHGGSIYNVLEMLEVTDTVNFRGHKAFVVDYGGGKNQYLQYYSGTDLFYVSTGDSAISHSVHYPLSPGEQYVLGDTATSFSPEEKTVLTLKNFHVPVSVPAGNFSCVQMEVAYLQGSASSLIELDNNYYAPNIGLVKCEVYKYTNLDEMQLSSVRLLLDYRTE